MGNPDARSNERISVYHGLNNSRCYSIKPYDILMAILLKVWYMFVLHKEVNTMIYVMSDIHGHKRRFDSIMK